MSHVSVIKYWKEGRYRSFEGALAGMERAQEKHPDRKYTIMVNRRSLRNYDVVWAELMTWRKPVDGEDIPPSFPKDDPDYEQREEHRDAVLRGYYQPLKDWLRKKMGG